jgi:hypothetical protein
MVYTAALALAGVCVLGLYLGIQPSLNRPGEADETLVPASAAPSMKPGMAAAVEATPLKAEAIPPSAAPPAQLAQAAKPKTPPSSADAAPASDAGDGAGPPPGARTPSPEPPTLYSPDEAPAPPPTVPNNNTPPY